MAYLNRFMATVLSAALIFYTSPLEGKTRKGDRLLLEGRAHEAKQEWDAAVKAYEQALSEDPSEAAYQMAVQKARFEASAMHLGKGVKLRQQGQLGDALVELQMAFALSPSSTVAEQELTLTIAMIERERKRVEQTGADSKPDVRGMTPLDEAKKEMADRIERLLPMPELRPLKPTIHDFKISNQTPKLLFDTLAMVAGLNVVYDPEYVASGPKDRLSLTLNDSTVQEALDYLAVVTKSYWKPLSSNTIFITMDNVNKRKDFEDEVVRIFYLANTTSNAELTALTTMVRTVTDCQRIFPMETQSAMVLKCSGDKIAVAEKLISDLDRARAEVVVDIFVIEASSTYVRNLTTALASTGINLAATFSPRSSIAAATSSTTTTSTSTTSSTTSDSSSSTSTAMPLSHIGKVNAGDFTTVLPSAVFQATLSDTGTKVLQSPQIRSVDGQKATMKIGEREPTATGSSQSSLGTVTSTGVNALVNTQFTYLDVGVNVEILPHVHENGDISLHVSLDISNVTGTKSLGGIDEPIIGQRKIEHDIRLREGEVSLLGGLLSLQDSKTKTGTPGLSEIPILGRLFKGESVDRERDEIMVALVPHVVRRQEITPENMRGIDTGPTQQVSVKRRPRIVEPEAADAGSTAKPSAGSGSTDSANAKPAAGSGSTDSASAAPAGARTGSATLVPPATAPPEDSLGAVKTAGQGTTRLTKLRFSEVRVEKKAGDSFELPLLMDDAAAPAAAELTIEFDPNVLKLEDVAAGVLWGAGSKPTIEKHIQNDVGRAKIRIARRPDGSGVAGSGSLLTLQFRSAHAGVTAVSISGGDLTLGQNQVTKPDVQNAVIAVR